MKVAIIFERWGPYHLARLSAAASRTELVGIEIAGESRTYAWDPISHAAFERLTLFPQEAVERLSSSRVVNAISTALGACRPDVVAVNGWSTPAALSALAWSIKHSVPAIVMSETNAWDRERRSLRERIKSTIVRSFSAGLVGGRSHVEYLDRLGLPAAKIFLGYDAVDNEHFAFGASAARESAERTRARLGLPASFALASSRFVSKKNLSRLIEAFAKFLASGNARPSHLVLVGDGPLKGSLEETARLLGIADRVIFAGFRQYADLPAYYGLAEFFIHASTEEQWGLVVNEAMASGVPVAISDRCGAAAELLSQEETGLTFDPLDVDAMAAAMRRLSTDVALRAKLVERARCRIADYGPERFARGLLDACGVALAEPVRGGRVVRLFLRTAAMVA